MIYFWSSLLPHCACRMTATSHPAPSPAALGNDHKTPAHPSSLWKRRHEEPLGRKSDASPPETRERRMAGLLHTPWRRQKRVNMENAHINTVTDGKYDQGVSPYRTKLYQGVLTVWVDSII